MAAKEIHDYLKMTPLDQYDGVFAWKIRKLGMALTRPASKPGEGVEALREALEACNRINCDAGMCFSPSMDKVIAGALRTTPAPQGSKEEKL